MFGRTDIGSLHITFSKPESVVLLHKGLQVHVFFLAGHPCIRTDIRFDSLTALILVNYM